LLAHFNTERLFGLARKLFFQRSLGLTQQTLADRLGVSFATVNRWENTQTKPSNFFWLQIERLIASDIRFP